MLRFPFILCLSLARVRFLANLEKASEPLEEARPGPASWHTLAPSPPSRLERCAIVSMSGPPSYTSSHTPRTTDVPNGSLTIGAIVSSTLPATVPCDKRRRWGSTQSRQRATGRELRAAYKGQRLSHRYSRATGERFYRWKKVSEPKPHS